VGWFNIKLKFKLTYPLPISVASLVNLHQRARWNDSQLEQVNEQTTVRQVWREVRDNLDQEAQARNAFINALKADVYGPLVRLRVCITYL